MTRSAFLRLYKGVISYQLSDVDESGVAAYIRTLNMVVVGSEVNGLLSVVCQGNLPVR